jgi:hypothetical protein
LEKSRCSTSCFPKKFRPIETSGILSPKKE